MTLQRDAKGRHELVVLHFRHLVFFVSFTALLQRVLSQVVQCRPLIVEGLTRLLIPFTRLRQYDEFSHFLQRRLSCAAALYFVRRIDDVTGSPVQLLHSSSCLWCVSHDLPGCLLQLTFRRSGGRISRFLSGHCCSLMHVAAASYI